MNIFKIIFSALVMGVVIYLLQPLAYQLMQSFGVLVLILIAGVVYVAMLFVTKVISKDMLKLLKKTEEPAPEIIEPPR